MPRQSESPTGVDLAELYGRLQAVITEKNELVEAVAVALARAFDRAAIDGDGTEISILVQWIDRLGAERDEALADVVRCGAALMAIVEASQRDDFEDVLLSECGAIARDVLNGKPAPILESNTTVLWSSVEGRT